MDEFLEFITTNKDTVAIKASAIVSFRGHKTGITEIETGFNSYLVNLDYEEVFELMTGEEMPQEELSEPEARHQLEMILESDKRL